MKKLLIITLFLFCLNLHAACNNLYPNNKKIVLKNTIELCNTHYVALHSSIDKRVILVSERIEPNSKFDIVRDNNFRPDTRIPNRIRSTLKDYTNSGYDRGHMAPADDAVTIEQMNDTFLLSNMTPQEPTLNRGAWKALEGSIRDQINVSNTLTWVVTKAAYKGSKTIGDGLMVPTVYYKMMYIKGKPVESWQAENIVNGKVVKIK
jgi:endonuclease G